MSIEQELEKLRNHNRELLGELKAAKANLTELQAKYDEKAAEAERYQLEVKNMRTTDAWTQVIKNTGMCAEMLKFVPVAAGDIGIDFDDAGAFFTKGGEPIKDGDVIYRPTNEEHCGIVMEPIREAHPFLWPRAQGAGPTGDRGAARVARHTEANKPSSFGIR